MERIVLVSTWLRSLVKGLTWELSGLATVAVIAYVLTGNALESMQAGGAFFTLRVLMYVSHERLWKRIKWGHHEVVQRVHRRVNNGD